MPDKISGRYTTPIWDIDIAGYYNIRQGYPFPQGILTPNRANQAGQTTVLLERMGDVRLENFQNADLRIGKNFNFGRARLSPRARDCARPFRSRSTSPGHPISAIAPPTPPIAGAISPTIRFALRR